MDNNQNNAGNPFHLDESSIGESKPTESDLGYDAKTFGTAGSNQTGTYNANPYNNQTGTYNADPYSNQTGTYDAGAYNYNMNQNAQNTVAEGTASLQAAQDDACAKKAKTSLILGIILNVLNLGMMCSTLFGGGFLYGGIFIILAIAGIQNANLGRKSSKRGMATAGLVLNIIAVVVSALFLILGFVLKFMD
ncbi:integral membrane protein [Clostridium sp. CAG:632]|mgnify:FL=1|nr:integral membrane protein [Clostridium sp. CAG:632]